MNERSNTTTLAFIFGCVFGSVVAYFIAKNMFAKKLSETTAEQKAEIESNLREQIRKEVAKERSDYDHILQENGYLRRESVAVPAEKEADNPNKEPCYYIPIDEYGELPDYETFNLILYADGILVDEDDMIVDDPASLLGQEIYSDLQEGEVVNGDSYFVRNDSKMSDYEISVSAITYREFAVERPDVLLRGGEEYDY